MDEEIIMRSNAKDIRSWADLSKLLKENIPTQRTSLR